MVDQYSGFICLLLISDTRIVLKRKFCFVKESFEHFQKESFIFKKKVIFKRNFCFIISFFISKSIVS